MPKLHCKGGHYGATGGIPLSPAAITVTTIGCYVHFNSNERTATRKQQDNDKQTLFGPATDPGISDYCSCWGRSKKHCPWNSEQKISCMQRARPAGLRPGCWPAGPQWNGCQSASRSAASLQHALPTGFSLHNSCNGHRSYIALLSSFPQGTRSCIGQEPSLHHQKPLKASEWPPPPDWGCILQAAGAKMQDALAR